MTSCSDIFRDREKQGISSQKIRLARAAELPFSLFRAEKTKRNAMWEEYKSTKRVAFPSGTTRTSLCWSLGCVLQFLFPLQCAAPSKNKQILNPGEKLHREKLIREKLTQKSSQEKSSPEKSSTHEWRRRRKAHRATRGCGQKLTSFQRTHDRST